MLTERAGIQIKMHCVTIEDLVPQDHFLRRLEKAVDFSFIRRWNAAAAWETGGGMHYLDHQSVDAAHGIVVDVAVTPGNVNDSEPYLKRIEYMREHLGLDIRAAGADSAYGTSMIYRAMEASCTRPGKRAGRPTRWNSIARINAEQMCWRQPPKPYHPKEHL